MDTSIFDAEDESDGFVAGTPKTEEKPKKSKAKRKDKNKHKSSDRKRNIVESSDDGPEQMQVSTVRLENKSLFVVKKLFVHCFQPIFI